MGKVLLPVYSIDLNIRMEQALGFLQQEIIQGKKVVSPFFIIFPPRADSELHQFGFETDNENLMLQEVDRLLYERTQKNPKVKFAIIGYTLQFEKDLIIVLEGYSENDEGYFSVTQKFKFNKTKVLFDQNAHLNYSKGHNPLINLINRKKVKAGNFEKESN